MNIRTLKKELKGIGLSDLEITRKSKENIIIQDNKKDITFIVTEHMYSYEVTVLVADGLEILTGFTQKNKATTTGEQEITKIVKEIINNIQNIKAYKEIINRMRKLYKTIFQSKLYEKTNYIKFYKSGNTYITTDKVDNISILYQFVGNNCCVSCSTEKTYYLPADEQKFLQDLQEIRQKSETLEIEMKRILQNTPTLRLQYGCIIDF